MNITEDMEEIEKILEQAEKIAKLEGSVNIIKQLNGQIKD